MRCWECRQPPRRKRSARRITIWLASTTLMPAMRATPLNLKSLPRLTGFWGRPSCAWPTTTPSIRPAGNARRTAAAMRNAAPPVSAMHVANPALTLEITLGQREIMPLQDMTRFYLLAEIGPAGVSAVLEPQPLDLALLVDRSNSMHGEKIFESIHAIQSMLDHLHMDDLLTLVFFDDFVEVVADGETPRGRPGIEEALKGITVRGSTELAKGLEVTLDRLVARTPSSGRARAASLVLLTDGQTYGDEQRCFDLANKARENGISITTLGLGAEWNRSLLDRLSAISGGSSHYVAKPADLTGHFEEVVHQLRATLALNMRMTFEPAPGAHIMRATRVAPDIAEAYDVPTDQLPLLPNSKITASSKVTVDLGALVGRPDRETAVVLWEFLLDPRQIASRLGEYALGEVSATYASTQHNNQMEQLQREVSVNVSETPSAVPRSRRTSNWPCSLPPPIAARCKLTVSCMTATRRRHYRSWPPPACACRTPEIPTWRLGLSRRRRSWPPASDRVAWTICYRCAIRPRTWASSIAFASLAPSQPVN